MSIAIVISITISLSIVGVFYIVMCTDSKNNAFLNTMMSTLNRIPGGRRAASAAVNAYVRSNVVANRSSFHSNSSSYLSSSNLHQSSQTHTYTYTGIHVFQKKSDSSDRVLGSSGRRIRDRRERDISVGTEYLSRFLA